MVTESTHRGRVTEARDGEWTGDGGLGWWRISFSPDGGLNYGVTDSRVKISQVTLFKVAPGGYDSPFVVPDLRKPEVGMTQVFHLFLPVRSFTSNTPMGH